MTYGPDNALAEIKNAIDIVQLIGEYIRVEPFGSKFRALCPFHDDKKPSLQIDPEFKNYRCWACGAKGDAFTFLQEFEKISFVEAKERLASRAGVVLKASRSGRTDSKARLVSVLEWAANLYQKTLLESRLAEPARQYLSQRGVSFETIQRLGLGFAPADFEWLAKQASNAKLDSKLLLDAGLLKVSQNRKIYDVFRGRILFPIRDTLARTIAFGGRIVPALDDGRGPKYLNSTASDIYNKSQVLYGLDIAAKQFKAVANANARSARLPLIVMEGYMDCLMAYQAGIANAVATCGTSLTLGHVQRIRGYTDRVVLMFDGDAAGQKASQEAVPLFLASEVDIRLCALPDNLDPCDFLIQRGAEQLKQQIELAPDALDYAINRAKTAYDSAGLDGRSRALSDVLEIFAVMPAILRGTMQQRFDLAVNRLAEAFRIEENNLRAQLTELRKRKADLARSASTQQTQRATNQRISPRDRTIAELIVALPARSGELQPLAPPQQFKNPLLRAIIQHAYNLCQELGERATTELLREKLDDPVQDSLFVELWDAAPKGDSLANAFADVTRSLADDLRRRQRNGQFRLPPNAQNEDHLAALRALASNRAPSP